MEEEADRIYWLIVRQLLLATQDRSTATNIRIESPFHIVGDRVVAKVLEEMADSAENIADEVIALKGRDMSREPILNEVAKFAGQVAKISERSLKGFLTGEIDLANEAVEIVENAENDERRLAQKVLTYVKDANLAASLRIITWNLGQIAKYSRIIGEVTINRIMEKPTEICMFFPVQ
jgi:phosphate uptake regulator